MAEEVITARIVFDNSDLGGINPNNNNGEQLQTIADEVKKQSKDSEASGGLAITLLGLLKGGPATMFSALGLGLLATNIVTGIVEDMDAVLRRQFPAPGGGTLEGEPGIGNIVEGLGGGEGGIPVDVSQINEAANNLALDMNALSSVFGESTIEFETIMGPDGLVVTTGKSLGEKASDAWESTNDFNETMKTINSKLPEGFGSAMNDGLNSVNELIRKISVTSARIPSLSEVERYMNAPGRTTSEIINAIGNPGVVIER